MTIVLAGVRKMYGNGFVAVRDLDLEIQDGEFFTLLGPSGCGKTTTLRMIAGLEQVSAGTIMMKDRDVTNVAPRHRDVAMVFQSYALYPHMTVRENSGLNLQVRKLRKDEISQRVTQIARMLQLDELLDRKPGQLSGGQRQRVALGRAIIRRPNVFLMDEPLSNLDLKLREETRTELKKLHEELRITTVYVTHDQSEALVLSDRIGIMRDGQLLQVGSPHQVYLQPVDTFVARFIGSPSINLLVGQLRTDGLDLLAEVAGTSGSKLSKRVNPVSAAALRGLGGDEVVIGIRPEDLQVHRESGAGRLSVCVEMVQPMGSVSYVVTRIPDQPDAVIDRAHMVAAVSPDDDYDRGMSVWLEVRGDRYCLFDKASGRNVDLP